MSLHPKRTIAELKELRELTSDQNGAQRVAWTETWLKARDWFQSKIQNLPVEHHYDAAGNSWTTLPGASEKTLIIGGHLDSVPNGGWLDGCLDFTAGLEVLRRFAEEFAGRPPVTVRLVDWADEEGARFGRSLLGSSAFAWKTRLRAAAFPSIVFPKRHASKRMRRLTSSCTSSKGRCSSACSCRWAWCWVRKA